MKVGFIGFGNMAQALAEGFAATGALKPCQIGACARDRAKLRRNTEPKGFLAFDDAARVAEFADMVIVAVKPHQVEAVLSPVKELLAGKIVVSVAAGMTFGKYETILAPGTHHLSTVPNTPVAVGEGIVVCERLHSLSDAEWKETERLFSHVGLVMQVDTPLLGLAGTICGCGPAFVAMFIEALADERGREFALEGHRWFDLVRLGLALDRFHEMGYKLDAHNLLFPIPQNQIEIVNDKTILWQNPGY